MIAVWGGGDGRGHPGGRVKMVAAGGLGAGPPIWSKRGKNRGFSISVAPVAPVKDTRRTPQHTCSKNPRGAPHNSAPPRRGGLHGWEARAPS